MDIDEIEVKARNIPYLDIDSITIHNTEHEDEIRAYFNERATSFCDIVVENDIHRCNICNYSIAWTFNWGITHGTGYCSECSWPYKAYHYIDVGEECHDLLVNCLLAYHPDLVFGG